MVSLLLNDEGWYRSSTSLRADGFTGGKPTHCTRKPYFLEELTFSTFAWMWEMHLRAPFSDRSDTRLAASVTQL